MHTTELMIKYLREIETQQENILACLVGTKMRLNHEKIEFENLVTHYL